MQGLAPKSTSPSTIQVIEMAFDINNDTGLKFVTDVFQYILFSLSHHLNYKPNLNEEQ